MDPAERRSSRALAAALEVGLPHPALLGHHLPQVAALLQPITPAIVSGSPDARVAALAAFAKVHCTACNPTTCRLCAFHTLQIWIRFRLMLITASTALIWMHV